MTPQKKASQPASDANVEQTKSFGGPSTQSGIEAGGTHSFGPPSVDGEIGTLGRYRIQKLLGQGGMGAVYLAYDERLGRKIALKVMLPKAAANAEAKDRFLREARSAAQITSEYVVATYDADEINGVPFIALQYLEGKSLDAFVASKGPLRAALVIRLGMEIALGLAAAHKLGFVHRDIKPSNIWLEAPSGRVKILDFGLAKSIDGGASVELTGTGVMVGTPAYMAPEQARGEKVDARTDLYGLGAVLYRLCTGKLPVKGETAMALLTSLAVDVPTSIREQNAEIPEPLAALIHQLLAKKPDQRPSSAKEVAARFKELATPSAAAVTAAAPVQKSDAEPIAEAKKSPAPSVKKPKNKDTALPGPSPEREPGAKEAPRPATQSFRPVLIFGAIAAVLLFVSGGVYWITQIIIVRDKDGNEVARVKVPKDGSIEIVPDKDKKNPQPKDDAKVESPKDKKDLSSAPTKALTDREVAEWVLSIGGGVQIDDTPTRIEKSLDLPKRVLRLTHVDFLESPKASDSLLGKFVDCQHLKRLRLDRTPIGDDGLSHFKNCSNLDDLGLNGTKVTDKGLANFKDHPNLATLWLVRTQVGNDTLATLKTCPRLKVLMLGDTKLTDAGLIHLKDFKSLSEFALWGEKISNDGLAHFKDCKTLERLHVSNTRIDDNGVPHLSQCKSLTYLKIVKTKITSSGFEQLKKALPKCTIESDHGTYDPASTTEREVAEWVLGKGGAVWSQKGSLKLPLPAGAIVVHKVSVPRSEITDEHAARIAEISTLQELHVPDTVTIGGLVWKSLGKLRLKVASSKPSDEAHTAFAGMPTLTDLQTPVTNNTQLNLYKDHPALERLSAKDSFVDDDGIKILITLQKLRQLDIKGCKITADGFEQLKKSLAKCRIESDHGTYVPAAEMVLTQRDAAEQLILKGASIQVHSKGQTYKSLPLPKGNIDVRSVEFFLKEELEDADLTLLKSFPKLEELRIANCKKLTDEGFRNLETLTSLRKLDLRGSGSAGAVDSIAKLTELQHLKCPDGMTSSAVEKLRPLKKLQTLEVGTSANLDDGLAALKELPELTQVDFHASGVTDKGAAILAEVLTLEVVRMHPTRVNMEGWRYLAKLPKLRVVHAQNFLNNLADIHQVFAEIKTLEKIEGKESSVTAKQLAFFKDHPSLKEIKLQWDSTDDQVPILLSMKALSVLTIKDTKITPAGFEQLKKGLPTCHIISDHGNYVPKAPRANDQEIAEWVLSRKGRVGIEGELSQFVDIKELPKREMTIRSVSLGKSYGDGKLVDADLAKLAGLKSIGYLSLSGAKNITDDGLQHLAGLTSLTWLDVSDCPKISGKGNVHLAKLTKLQTLGVCAQSDDDLTPILGLKGVYQLFLNKTKITAAGLAKIQAALPDLKVLHLDDVPLDDASVVEFGRMMNLTGLIITRTKITPAGFEQLKKAMPNCRIESDHGTHVPTKAK